MWYSDRLKAQEGAVALSCDEVTMALFDNNLGEKHDEMTRRIQAYLLQKALDIIKAGCSVILEWGFWTRESRRQLTEFCRNEGIPCEWHYVDVRNAIWRRNIEEQNSRIRRGEGGSDYYLDEGLMNKLLSLWAEPDEEEIDVRYVPERD